MVKNDEIKLIKSLLVSVTVLLVKARRSAECLDEAVHEDLVYDICNLESQVQELEERLKGLS